MNITFWVPFIAGFGIASYSSPQFWIIVGFTVVGMMLNLLMSKVHYRQFAKMFPMGTIQTQMYILKWFNGKNVYVTSEVFGFIDGLIILGIIIPVTLLLKSWIGA